MMRLLSMRWKDCRIRFWRANTSSPCQLKNAWRLRSKRPASFWNEEPANECIFSFSCVSLLTAHMINDLWYKNAVIYCLSVGTYMDADGDGTGDFRGLMRRLDYLHGLGGTAIWLLPVQTSPCRDDGYDVADYYNVDPRYGTLGDFIEFTHGAEQRGIRVLIDLVVNHTSDKHPWFN